MWAALLPLLESIGVMSLVRSCATLIPKLIQFLGLQMVASGAFRFMISTAQVTAWGVFLLVVTTGITGMHLFALFSQNPLQGMPGDMFELFCTVFPFSFLLRLTIAYIVWNFTFMQAALVMMRVNKYFFGG